MLSNIWGGVRGAINSAASFGSVAQDCGGLFRLGTCTVNISGLFITRLFAILADSERRRLVNPSVRQFVLIGPGAGSLTFEKATEIRYRAKVEGNG